MPRHGDETPVRDAIWGYSRFLFSRLHHGPVLDLDRPIGDEDRLIELEVEVTDNRAR
jgi:hypothetical protein